MDIDKLYNAVSQISKGLEQGVMKCLGENKQLVADLIREQLYSGLDGNLTSLYPSYDDDPWFSQTKSRWRNDPDGYIEWKEKITPPEKSKLLSLPARPRNIPNLYITGPFHDSIKAYVNGDTLMTESSGFSEGGNIVRKYGEDILLPSTKAREYLIEEILGPWFNSFVKQCGYR